MNNTLTGLGIALVVALVTALVGPFFIDWNDHRAAFEAAASRLVGVPVRVLGEVDARLLPSPRIRFSQVVAGDEWAASRFSADSFELDLALMPLISGEYQVTSLRVDGADLKASLSADGEISLPIMPGVMTLEGLDAIKITDLEVRGSRITLADPAANRNVVVENVRLAGQASSLAGPLKFDAHGKIGDDTYTLHAAAGRFDRNGTGLVKITLDGNGAPSLALDGSLQLSSKPRFEGTGSLVQPPAAEGQPRREPWRITGAVKADIRHLEADQVDFEYGGEGRDLRLAGGLGVVFGPKPSAEIRLKGRQIDLDRVVGRAKDAAPLPPAAALAALAERFPITSNAPVPLKVVTDVETVLLSGDIVQGLRAKLASTPGGWTVETLAARLPGNAGIEASGALMVRDGEGPRFNGPVKLDAPNMPNLVRWLEASADKRPSIALKQLKLNASVAARPGSYALEDMTALADGADIKGRLAFTDSADSRNRLEARLTAQTLDLDALDLKRLSAFVNTSRGTDVELALRARKLGYARVTWQGVDIDLSATEGAVDVRRLSIADLGGAKINATGRLARKDSQPSGRLEARIEADNLDGLVTVLRTSSLPPDLIDAIGARTSIITPAALTAVLSSSGGGTAGVSAKVTGSLAGTALEFDASAPGFALSGPVKAKFTASSADGARLFGQLGLPVVVQSFGPASLAASLDGDPARGGAVDIAVTAGADRLTFKGKAESKDGKLLAGRMDMALEDVSRYAVLLGRAPPSSLPTVPLTAGGDVTYGESGFEIARLAGLAQGRALKGALSFGGREGLRGEVDLASLSLSELVGAALGPLALGEPDAAGWPSGQAAPSLFAGVEGRVTVRTDNFEIAPGYTGGRTKFNLVLDRNEFAVQNVEIPLAGGKLKGDIAVRRADADLSVAARLATEGAEIGGLIWGGQGGPAATGKLDLTADMLGTGKTISAVVAGLTGSGSFTLKDAKLGGVDAGAFERTLIAVEGGSEPPDAADIARRFGGELAMADLEVSDVSSAFTIASGVVRVSNAAIAAPLVTATASGTLDLAKRQLAAHMTVRPKVLADIEEASVPSADLSITGPWNAPARSVETTAFANVLAVRAVEREIERVEKMEAERRERERKAVEEEARRLAEEERRKAEEAEAARLKAIQDATGDVPLGDLPPPVQITPPRASSSGGSSGGRQSPLDFLRRPVVPEASR